MWRTSIVRVRYIKPCYYTTRYMSISSCSTWCGSMYSGQMTTGDGIGHSIACCRVNAIECRPFGIVADLYLANAVSFCAHLRTSRRFPPTARLNTPATAWRCCYPESYSSLLVFHQACSRKVLIIQEGFLQPDTATSHGLPPSQSPSVSRRCATSNRYPFV